MNNTFINPVLTKASVLGVGLYEDNEPIELFSNASSAETELVIRAIYRQVLGNAHIMESERLTIVESQLINGNLTVREFVRYLANSDLYRSLFFNNYTSLRAIELNFKHLLGRAPHNYDEVVQKNQIFHEEGYEAEIDSYIDSKEYLETFGENIVPYYQGYKTQTGKNVSGFTHLFNLLRGSCSSDRSTFRGAKPRLQTALISNKASTIIPLSTVSGTFVPSWKPPVTAYRQKTITDRRISQTLNLKTYQPIIPITKLTSAETSVKSRSAIWQNQYNAFEDSNPIEFISGGSGSSEAEAETAIKAVYKQVLGNAHIMESERLTVAESQLKRDEISIREFVRWVAKSELYKSRFIDNCPRYRSHELNFKHLLGRAPDGYQETLYHSQVLDSKGYEADIDSYIDSDEYQEAFGENIIPYYRGYKTQTGKKLLGYTNMFKMLESVSTSDKAGISGNSPRLIAPIIYNNPDGNVPITDIDELLKEVLKPKTQSMSVATEFVPRIHQPNQENQNQDLEQEIADLEAQLAKLKSFATIGSAGVSKWQSYYTDINYTTPSSSTSSSWNQVDSSQTKQERIAALKQEIAQAKSLASIGEARLNKWRSKVFF